MKTPQQSYPNIAKELGIANIFLKREDLHTYGSHKGRSIPFMIKHYIKKENKNNFAISSSGNAALAAIFSVIKHNKNNPQKQITLEIYVGKNIDKKKLEVLKKHIVSEAITLNQVERPKQTVFKLEKDGEAQSLRQSTDEIALEAYSNLAQELLKIPNLQAVFVPSSSGTTAQAIAQAFSKQENIPEVHIVQTTKCNPMAKIFDTNFTPSETSLAGAIVDNIAHRKNIVIESIKITNGSGWVVNDELLKKAKEILNKNNINTSYNGSLALAGLLKAIKKGKTFDFPVACIIGGQ